MIIGPNVKQQIKGRRQTKVEMLEIKFRAALCILQEYENTLQRYQEYEEQFANAPGWAAKAIVKGRMFLP